MVVKLPEDEKRPFTPRPLPILAPLLNAIYKHKPDLLNAWLISHLVFAAAMSLTPFVDSLLFATTLIAICGMYVDPTIILNFFVFPGAWCLNSAGPELTNRCS